MRWALTLTDPALPRPALLPCVEALLLRALAAGIECGHDPCR
jgi:hypothetical protein